MRTLIRNGAVIRETRQDISDILIEDGIIAAIDEVIDAPGAEVIDASDCYVFPGFIDTHTHFALEVNGTQTADDFLTGTRAAILGGTTTVIDFADHQKGHSLSEVLEYKKNKAQGSSCNYAFHMALSEWNDYIGAEMAEMFEAGVTSYKMYMVYGMRVDDGEIYCAMKRANELGAIISAHCENYYLLQRMIQEQKILGNNTPMGHALSRPNEVEAEAVRRFLSIAKLAGAPAYVVHLSTAGGLEAAIMARSHNMEVYLETCPQYLLLDKERYNDPDGAKYVMSPPLRSFEDNGMLMRGLKEGIIDTVGTDHCSFNMAQKALGKGDFTKIPNGAPGVQTRPMIYYAYGVKSGQLTLLQMASQLSTNAAKLFGMYPRKGTLSVGSDADIVIWEPSYSGVISHKSLAHNCDNTPFEGMRIEGRARDVFLGGTLVVCGGKLIKEGLGRYIKRDKPLRYRNT